VSEEWRAIPGHEGYYEVSDEGRVRSLDRLVFHSGQNNWHRRRGMTLTAKPNVHDGYRRVTLRPDRRPSKIAVLVLVAFRGPRPEGDYESCHNNGVRADDRLSNLRWDTVKANQADRRLHGTHECYPRAKLTKEQIMEIRALEGSMPQTAIAGQFGICQTQVSHILRRICWREL
jgi:hypothetical protein